MIKKSIILLLTVMSISPLLLFGCDKTTEVESKIAFTSNRDGDSEIYIMNSDGSNQVRLTDSDASDWGPSWSR